MTIATHIPLPQTLASLSRRAPGTVAGVDWDQLTDGEARRLREFGLDEGVEVELLHAGRFGSGPVAARIGRMTVTFRRHIARAIHVQPA